MRVQHWVSRIILSIRSRLFLPCRRKRFRRSNVNGVARRKRLKVATLLATAMFSFELTADEPDLFSSRFWDVGQRARKIAVGDFDGDGDQDIATTDDLGTVAVNLDTGNGSYPAGLTYPVGSGPRDIVAADFNNDGLVDLANLNSNSNDVSVLIAAGGGDFLEELRIPVGGLPRGIVTADFNGDGFADLATSNGNTNDLSVIINDQMGGFSTSQIAVGNSPRWCGVGEFDGDGILDIVTYFNSDVHVLRGVGDGSFERPIALGISEGYREVATGDFDGDGFNDMAFPLSPLYSFELALSVRFGNGNLEFGDPVEYNNFCSFSSLVAADVNGDGRPDLLANAVYNELVVFQSNTDRTFSIQRDAIAGGTDIATADFNGDGFTDVAACDYFSNGFTVDVNDGTGQFSRRQQFDVVNYLDQLATGDFNGDGWDDILHTDFVFPKLNVRLGDGAGGFSSNASTDTSGLYVASAIGVTELNGDGFEDLAFARYGSVQIFESVGNGEFVAGDLINNGANARSIAFDDFNGDGFVDLVTVLSTSSAAFALGNGDGTFGSVATIGGLTSSHDAVTGDLDLDGIADVVIAGGDNLYALIGVGDGTFVEPAVTTSFAAALQDVALTDFDEDGFLDVVALSDGVVLLASGLGDGSFVPNGQVDVGFIPEGIVIGDVDGDGRKDIIASARNVAVARGLGAGGFEEPIVFLKRTSATALPFIADLDGNDQEDIVLSYCYFASVTAQFEVVELLVSQSPEFALGDVNLDSLIDLSDVIPFVDLLVTGRFQREADINCDGAVDLIDVDPFVELLFD